MGKVSAGPKVLVAAAFAPVNLVLLGGSWFVAFLIGFFVWGILGTVAGLGGTLLYARSVLELASDPNFARKALEAGDMSASSLKGSRKLAVLERFGKLPPIYQEKVKLLQDLGGDVENRLEKGAGTVYDQDLNQLAPQVRATLEEAVGLAAKGAEMESEGRDTAEIQGKLDRIVEILESMKDDLLMMEGDGAEELSGDTVVLQLEDLSGQVKVLKESLVELDG